MRKDKDLADYLVENTVILVNFSRRKFKIAYKGIKKFMKKKREIDPHDAMYLMAIKKVPASHKKTKSANISPSDLHNSSSSDDSLIEIIEDSDSKNIISTLKPRNFCDTYQSSFGHQEALILFECALLHLGDKIRNISGQINRVLLVCDNIDFLLGKSPKRKDGSENFMDLSEIVEKAKGLDIFLDVALIADKDRNIKREQVLSSIIEPTKGEFGRFFKKRAFYKGMEGFASKKIIEEDVFEILSPEERKKGNLSHLLDIASPLRRPSQEEISDLEEVEKYFKKNHQIKEDSKFQCRICFQMDSPLSGFPFAKIGRFCPRCGIPMHLDCAANWALKSEDFDRIFRCPHCYNLLKIDKTLIQGLKIRKSEKSPLVKLIKVSSEELVKSGKFCSYCLQKFIENNKSSENDSIYRCSACNAHYHIKCLEDMYSELKKCINCGGQIV